MLFNKKKSWLVTLRYLISPASRKAFFRFQISNAILINNSSKNKVANSPQVNNILKQILMFPWDMSFSEFHRPNSRPFSMTEHDVGQYSQFSMCIFFYFNVVYYLAPVHLTPYVRKSVRLTARSLVKSGCLENYLNIIIS